MITELEVSGFKALRNVRLEGLKRLTLIGGKNNTGKSSLLEAFFLSLDWGNPALLTRHLQTRGIDAFSVLAESAWLPAFSDFRKDGKIQVRTRMAQGERRAFTAQLLEPSGRVTALPTSTDSQANILGTANIRSPGEPSLRLTYTRGSKAVYEAQVVITGQVPPYTLQVTKADEQASHIYFLPAQARASSSDNAVLYGRLDQEKRTEGLVKSLQIIEPKLRGLSVIPIGPQSQLFADLHGMTTKIPVNLLGDGITRLLTILLYISNLGDGYLLVDEVENGFHYSVMRQVWETVFLACKAQGCQLFATTHSYECLTAFADGLKEIATDDYSYVRLEMSDQEITAVGYSAQSLRDATAGGWEVR